MGKIIDNKKIQLEELEMLVEIDKICRNANIPYYLAYGSVLGAVRHKGFIPWDTDIDIMIAIENIDKFVKSVEANISKKYYLFSAQKDNKYDSLKPRIGLLNKKHHRIHIDIFPMVGIPNNGFLHTAMPKFTSILYKVFFLKQFDSDTVHKHNFRKRLKHRLAKIILLPMPIRLIKKIFNYICLKYPVKNSDFIYNICGSYGSREIIPRYYLGQPVYMEFEGHNFPIPREWDKYLKQMYGDYMIPKQY